MLFLAVAGLARPHRAAGADRPASLTALPPAEVLRLGERMYREGVLPSGKPMNALVKGDIPVSGTAFTCVSCHQRSGIGSYEGGVFTPPATGAYLFREQRGLFKGPVYKGAQQSKKFSRIPPRRPPYTDASLARVLRSGVDPTGRTLNDVMPRYLLGDKDMAVLIAYLKSLSASYSPGVTDTTIHFATVVADDVPPGTRAAFLAPLRKIVAYKNDQTRYYQTRTGGRSGRMAETMLVSREAAYKKLSLSVWELKGPPATWDGQLAAYYRREPVFALLSGITSGEWRPVHRFCEENRIPCLFPITDFPVISNRDWYTLYFSRGMYQEGAAAARYLNGTEAPHAGDRVLQIVRDSREGKALSAGFTETWQEEGHRVPATVTLRGREPLTRDLLQKLLAREKPAFLVVWDGPGVIPALAGIGGTRNAPATAIVSASYVGKALLTLPDRARDLVYATYPYRLPQDELPYTRQVESFLGKTGGDDRALIMEKQIFDLYLVLSQALSVLNGDYYRDNLLDVIGMNTGSGGMSMGWYVEPDTTYPLYERLSFGPGQRYASKGCYVVQLTHGADPHLVKKGDWVVQ